MIDKKGISSIVAITLLIVVAVITVVGFQGWFKTYSSSLFTKIEQQSSDYVNDIGIQNVIDSTLYFKNDGVSNITITAVEIGNNDCNVSGNFSPGILTIHLRNNCTLNLTTSTPNIVVYTKNGIYSKSIYVNNVVSLSSTSSGKKSSSLCAGLNGGDWVEVPGNSALGTSNFCIMKYEAKFANLTGKVKSTTFKVWHYNTGTGNMSITSTPTPEPIAYINQTQARNACASLGLGYHLTTDIEWMTILRNIENVSSNWNSSVVGIGFLYSGYSDNNPGYALNASSNDSDGYYGTDSVQSQRRTMYLSNGQVIWDFAGNLWEWQNDTTTAPTGNLGKTSWTWWPWNSISGYPNLIGINASWGSTQGLGEVYTGGENASYIYGYLRGGSWANGPGITGISALFLSNQPSTSGLALGFRCVYSP